MWWCPISLMSAAEYQVFEAVHVVQTFGEVGSRQMQRLFVARLPLRAASGKSSTLECLISDWQDVQFGRYRYLAIDDDGGVKIRIVIGEYLACEVIWIV